MKALATLTSRGQVTISKSVRSLLHLETGDSVEFAIASVRVELRVAKSRQTSVGALKSHLPRRWKAPAVEVFDFAIGQHLARQHRAP